MNKGGFFSPLNSKGGRMHRIKNIIIAALFASLFALAGTANAFFVADTPISATNPVPSGVVDTFGNSTADSVGHSSVITEIDHYIIHRGAAFLASDTISVASAGTADFVISNTTAVEVHLKDFQFTSTEGDATLIFYKGVTANVDGTLVPLNDKNFITDNTSTATIRLDPTAVNIGAATQILHFGLVGGKKSGGLAASGSEEFVLKQNEKCLLRYTNNAAGADTISYTITTLDVGAL